MPIDLSNLLLKMSPLLPLLWRLPEGLMRRVCVRQRTGKDSRRRNVTIRGQQHRKR
jgi:hypothetical protein